MTKVYVAVLGIYSSQGVGGVYDTPERAMAANHSPGMKWYREVQKGSNGREFVTWENDKDFDSAVRIEPFELVAEGPERREDIVRTYDSTPYTRVDITEVALNHYGE